MSILVVTATKHEIAPFLEKYPEAEHLITGVGAPVAIYHIQERVYQKKYDVIFQVGIAGNYSDDLLLGDVVCIKKDCFADVGVVENGSLKSFFELGFGNADQFPFQDGWLINNHEMLLRTKNVSALTVNLLTDDRTTIGYLQKRYEASVESMEGAALHYVCLQKNIPFLQIRGVSNQVGERDKTKWKIKEAIASSNQLLAQLYQEYISKMK